MAFALWIDDDTAWAQGTHEYRAMGTAVIAAGSLFTARDFSPRRRTPPRGTCANSYVGLFASLNHLNRHLVKTRSRIRKINFRRPQRPTPSYI
jgi:hypothetical protein